MTTSCVFAENMPNGPDFGASPTGSGKGRKFHGIQGSHHDIESALVSSGPSVRKETTFPQVSSTSSFVLSAALVNAEEGSSGGGSCDGFRQVDASIRSRKQFAG